MAIEPVSLPGAAGLQYGEGDVRHFSPGDAIDVPGMSNPTRYLAERDNIIAETLNEVVGVVNNQEQPIQLPIVRTVVPATEEIIVLNYRIPPGFESRVLDAAVSAQPLSTNIELNVYYAQGFGNNTGTAIVTTASEFTGGVQFYQTGEFIITLKNTGPTSLEMAASVLLTLRPVGAQGTLLVGTIIEGPQGVPGQTGPPGPQGVPGTGGAGTPGMVWQGQWTNGNSYNVNDVVSFALFGTIVSSFICRVANTASTGVNDPGTDDVVTWNTVALGGATGAAGPQGIPGAILNAPIMTFTPFSGTLITGGDWVAGNDTVDGYLGTGLTANGTFTNLTVNQFSISSGTTAGNTLAMLFGNPKLYFTGHGTIRLPNTNDGTAFNYSNIFIKVTVEGNGTAIPTVTLNNTTLVSFGTWVAPPSQTIISTGTWAGTTPSPQTIESFGTWITPGNETIISYGTQGVTVAPNHSISILSVTSPHSDYVITVVDPFPVKVQLNIFGAQNQ